MNKIADMSVIVPVYNAQRYLSQTIDSIINQTFSDFELLLIDDGSTDDSLNIMKEYESKDLRIRLTSKENAGVSSARNRGIEEAKGEYLVFVDADDLLEPGYLENLYNQKEFDYVITGFKKQILGVSGSLLELSSNQKENRGMHLSELPTNFFVEGLMHPCWGKLYKSSIVKKFEVRFPEVRLSEDSLFNLEYLQHIQSWKIDEEHKYIYCCRNESATKKFNVSDIDIYIGLYKKMLAYNINKKVAKKVVYAQYMATILKLIRSDSVEDVEKTKILRGILKKETIKKIILSTMNNIGEWITGLLICTGRVSLVKKWIYK